jgi:hypothetical protein
MQTIRYKISKFNLNSLKKRSSELFENKTINSLVKYIKKEKHLLKPNIFKYRNINLKVKEIMKPFFLVVFIICCHTLFGLAQNCEDAKKANCEVMKALCNKGVKVNETLIENMCPKTCDACAKTLVTSRNDLKSNRALVEKIPLNVTTNFTLISNQTLQKNIVSNNANGLLFPSSFGFLTFLSIIYNM